MVHIISEKDFKFEHAMVLRDTSYIGVFKCVANVAK